MDERDETRAISEEDIKKYVARIEGSELYEKLRETGFSEQEFEKMIHDIKNGCWSKDVAVEIEIKGKKIDVYTPDKPGDDVPVNPDRYSYVADKETDELIFNTIDGWRKTGLYIGV